MLTKKIAKYIQSLSHKKFRDEENAFIAEGPKVVEEFLMAKMNECLWLIADKDWPGRQNKLVESVPAERFLEVRPHQLESLSLLKTPNQVLAIFKKREANLVKELSGKISLMLDDLQDPGNMGTIIRIADWFGIQQIICSDKCVDCYNPKVVQATMGSLARVHIFYTDLPSFIQKNQNLPLYAAALEGKPLYGLGPVTEGFVVIGNESKGIHPELLDLSQHQINIPRIGGAESLNAAVATGIILSHLVGGIKE